MLIRQSIKLPIHSTNVTIISAKQPWRNCSCAARKGTCKTQRAKWASEMQSTIISTFSCTEFQIQGRYRAWRICQSERPGQKQWVPWSISWVYATVMQRPLFPLRKLCHYLFNLLNKDPKAPPAGQRAATGGQPFKTGDRWKNVGHGSSTWACPSASPGCSFSYWTDLI